MDALNNVVNFLGEEINRAQAVNDMINTALKEQGWDIDKAIRETRMQSKLLHMGYKPSEVLRMMKEMEV